MFLISVRTMEFIQFICCLFIQQYLEQRKSHLLYGQLQLQNLAGHKREGEKDRMREREERVRDDVWLEKGRGVGHKFDCWSNSWELRDKQAETS